MKPYRRGFGFEWVSCCGQKQVNSLPFLSAGPRLYNILSHVCWSFRLLAIPFVGRSVCWSIRLLVYPSLWPFRLLAVPSVGLSVCWSICLLVNPFVGHSVCWSFRLLVIPSVG